MSVIIQIGRRVPKSWMRKVGQRIGGLISFQENIWIIVKQSLSLAKKKANRSEDIKFNITYDTESEDLRYNIEWIKVVIQGPKEKEQEEYEEAMKLYEPMVNMFKKEFPKDDNISKAFKTKMLSPIQLEKAYKEGYGAVNDSNMSQKLLEMGILTNIEFIDDFGTRSMF